MIDVINIFNKGGLLLWSYNFYEIDDTTIRTIVKHVLIEEKYEEFSKKHNNYHAKWKLINDLELVILIVYQGIQNSTYLENLFLQVKKNFIKKLPKNKDVFDYDFPIDFDDNFLEIVENLDEHKNLNNNTHKSDNKKNNKHNTNNKSDEETSSDNQNNSNSTVEEDDDDNNNNNVKNKKNVKVKKTAREWELSQKITKRDIRKLDYSKNDDNDINNKNKNNEMDNDNNNNNNNNIYNNSKYEGDDDDDDSSDGATENKNNILNKLNDSLFKMFSYNSKIEEEDIEKILHEIKNKLLSKNVAIGICDTLIDRMKENLIGKKKTLFALNVKKTVSNVLSETIQSILIPKDSVDVLRSAIESKSLGKLYSIVFLGVNGVGKSTNLAKVCYYLKNKGNLKIMIAACDTFRAGAVEQLRIHANCLNVFLYEKGYGKDASAIAKEAILYAKKENYDVILIDTAGRMQDNEPLMRSLGKLILYNNPDLILFVGEALVGNDAIDQLKKFNQALTDATCNSTNKRTIDGIILTKFDTVDDKVGTALSMVYLTGKPIVFVGVGQKYTHLKKFNVNMVVKALS
ncbi:signal recognition particle receptor alpha subunit [Plasmodium sp. gorilla clade G2]|uniref:signal recognition particle receptor alpha subunit n=1 Tax=Plasmodium sp. gorilla clade G2 TaxID=880535 RepID=UPI000D21ABC5|nr:signal recognition particle receptor alpha subunit [Plasmodium sp. gorilla clade G2]SOV18485.1 signal recognition particle receptor alpha subunit [Plasmodium sp. gorilla clade G2]